ncbi:MAG TPA: hypothetical protein VHE53_05370 [Patescibacteria group bacterium]|nr:hypothetical protein [Patescibacteria group bacterium]
MPREVLGVTHADIKRAEFELSLFEPNPFPLDNEDDSGKVRNVAGVGAVYYEVISMDEYLNDLDENETAEVVEVPFNTQDKYKKYAASVFEDIGEVQPGLLRLGNAIAAKFPDPTYFNLGRAQSFEVLPHELKQEAMSVRDLMNGFKKMRNSMNQDGRKIKVNATWYRTISGEALFKWMDKEAKCIDDEQPRAEYYAGFILGSASLLLRAQGEHNDPSI